MAHLSLSLVGPFQVTLDGQPVTGFKSKVRALLAYLAEALALVEQTDERHWEAELYRLKGELLLMQGDDAEAEASFHRAI